MKFKSKLSLIGLSLLIGGINAHAMDIDDNQYSVTVRNMMNSRSVIFKHNGTYEGFSRAYEKAFGEDVNKIRFNYCGKPLSPTYDFTASFGSVVLAIPAIKPIKDANEITEGTTPLYKTVTDRLKRKLGIFEEQRKVFLDDVKNKRYLQCGEPLLQFSAALDDAISMYKLNLQNRTEMQDLVLKTFKVDPDLYKPEKEEELLKVTSLDNAQGIKKANAATNLIWNFDDNMSVLPSHLQVEYIQTLEDFFKENVIRNNIFASLVIGYVIKNPEEPKEKHAINHYVIENLGYGDQASMNDWLTCSPKVARQVIEQFNTVAGKTGETFGDIVISTRAFHKELKEGDKITY